METFFTSAYASLNRKLQPLVNRLMPKWVTPNMVTISHVILAAPVLILFFTNHLMAAFIVYIIAASLDYLDGLLARSRGQVSDFGKLLDAMTDKIFFAILVVPVTTSITIKGQFSLAIDALIILSALHIANETWLACKRIDDYRRSLLARSGKRIELSASGWGKIKAILQSAAIGSMILAFGSQESLWLWLANSCLLVALPFGISSLVKKYR